MNFKHFTLLILGVHVVSLSVSGCFAQSNDYTLYKLITDLIKGLKLFYPKVLLSNGTVGLGKRLFRYAAENKLQCVVRLNFDLVLLEKIVNSDYMTLQIVIIGNKQQLLLVLQKFFQMKWLMRPGFLIFLCLNCENPLFNVEGYDVQTQIFFGTFKRLQKITYVKLYAFSYEYKSKRMLAQYYNNWTIENGLQSQPFLLGNDIFKEATLNILCMKHPIFMNYVVEITSTLSSIFNFGVNMTISKTKIFEERLPNGTWIGVIPEFIQGNYDLLIGCFSSNPRRRKIVDLTVPVLEEHLAIAVHYPSLLRQNAWMFTKNLFNAKIVWFLTFFILILTGVCLKLTIKSAFQKHASNWPLLLIFITLNQGKSEMLHNLNSSLIIVIIVSSLFFWMLTSYYGMFLTSLLAIKNDYLMSSVSEFAKSSYQIGVKKGSATVQFLNYSTNRDIKIMSNKAIHFPDQQGLDALCLRNTFGYAIGVNEARIGITNRKPCPTYFLKEFLFKDPFHFITKNKENLDDRLSIGIWKMREFGVLKRILRAHGLSEGIGSAIVEDEGERDNALHLFQLADIFVYFALSIVLALIVLLLEILYFHRGKKFSRHAVGYS